VREADMGIIICPSAALSMKQLPMTAPLHNSIAPFVKLREAGVRTYLGVDNVHDLFMPMVDGDMWTEARMLMESCRFYDIDAVAEWACQKPVPLQASASKPAEPRATAAVTASAADREPVKKRAASGGRRR
jgi:cytosine/creatinine deaminase